MISGSHILNTAHGHDDMSIRMLKIYDAAIVEPLKIPFVDSVNQAECPSQWKKPNKIFVHKKTKNIL